MRKSGRSVRFSLRAQKEEDLKLGRAKLRGYLVRGDNDQSSFELLVGQHSFLVVRAKERRKSPRGMLEVTTTMKRLEVNAAMDDSLFCSSHSEAGAKWKR